MKPSKNTDINDYTIKLIKDKQPPHGFIYALSPVELETLKAYTKTHLKTRFIRPFKSLPGASNIFDKRPDSSLHLCADYQDLNNLIIKNWYLLLLIGKSLDCLSRAKYFT